MTKISGIKGINISKASVLKDGSKKSGANDSFRDTANGTTRDNSKNNNQSALDAAMIKMLLGQTELMAKKAASIEEQMKIAAAKEADRIKREEYYWHKRPENDEKQAKAEAERNFDEHYNKIDNGIINGMLSSFLGPVGVMLGQGLNKAGLPLENWGKKGVRAIGRGLKRAFSSIGKTWGRKSKAEGGEGSDDSKKSDSGEDAVSVNKKEMAAEPVNRLKSSVTKRLDTIIKLMGGKRGGLGGDEDNRKGLLDWLAPFLPLLAGVISGYDPLKEFGTKYLLKKFRKILDPIIEWTAKFGNKVWNRIKGPLKKAGAKIWRVIKTPLAKAGRFVGNSLKKLGSKIMSSGIGRALKRVAKSISKSGIVQGLKTLAKKVSKTASKLLRPVGKVLSKVARPLVKVGKKLVKPLEKVGRKILSKVAGKGGAKALGKRLFRKIPGVGLLSGLWFAGKKAMQGDWTGAALELASGAATTIPNVGTAVSFWLDGLILAKEMKKDLDAEKAKNQAASEGSYETEEPVSNDYSYMEESANKQNAILDILSQIENNLRPEVQHHLDEQYLNSAQRIFDRPPTAPQYELGVNGMATNNTNPLGVR